MVARLEHRRSMINPSLFIPLLLLSKVFDLITTYIALTNGLGYESNYLSVFLLTHGGWGVLIMVSFSVMLGVAVVLLSYQKYLIEKNMSLWCFKILKFGAFSCVAINMIAGINNILVALGLI